MPIPKEIVVYIQHRCIFLKKYDENNLEIQNFRELLGAALE